MDMDTAVNGLAHELWAIAQGQAPIDDVVQPIMVELQVFADAVRAAERERWAVPVRQLLAAHEASLELVDGAVLAQIEAMLALEDLLRSTAPGPAP